MAVSKKIINYLKENNIKFEEFAHTAAFTAQESAEAQHVPGRQFVKVVIVSADKKPVMCVLPAIHLIDFDKLKKLLNVKDVFLMSEDEIAAIFPEYEIGAEPPFGHFYGLDVYVDEIISNENDVIFNAGTHSDAIKVSYDDFIKLTSPTVAKFGIHI